MMMCTDNRFEIIEKAKKDILEATNINTSPDEMKVLDDFLFRCWQMDWLKMYEQPKVGEWIPCSEQEEPTEDGMYLVSGRWLRSGEKVVDSCGFFGEWKCVNNFIIEAWMPLPPAYKGE